MRSERILGGLDMSFSEWREVKLEDIIEIEMGQSPKSEFYNQTGEGLPFLQGNRTFGDKYPYFDTYCTENKKIANKNDVIMSVRAPVGDLNIAQTQISLGRGVCAMRLKGEQNSNYLFYLMKHNIKEMINRESGTVFGSVNKKDILGLDVKITNNKLEQKAIAHILSTLDDKIEVNKQINKTLENMAQAIFKQWFVDFEFPNEDGEPYKSSGGEMVESELGLIPKGWEVKPFEDAFYFQEGPGIRNWQYVENGTKFINIRCIRDNDLYLETANMISFEEAEGKYKHFMIDSGDIVMSTSGTLGRYSIVREEHLPLCLNTSVIRFKPLHGQEHYSYMYAYLTSNEFLNHLTTKASGSVQKNFGPMHLRQIKLLYPNVSIIKLLNAIISPIIKSSLHTKKENDKLKKLRDALLPKLMSGEIRVPLDSEVDVS
jgi:type I restriction enzyme S subunit